VGGKKGERDVRVRRKEEKRKREGRASMPLVNYSQRRKEGGKKTNTLCPFVLGHQGFGRKSKGGKGGKGKKESCSALSFLESEKKKRKSADTILGLGLEKKRGGEKGRKRRTGIKFLFLRDGGGEKRGGPICTCVISSPVNSGKADLQKSGWRKEEKEKKKKNTPSSNRTA